MSRYVTLGADENGEVYGVEINDRRKWSRNPFGFHTSCVVIRPVTKDTFEYLTEDPDSAKELWKSAVEADRTEDGLEEWFADYVSNYDVLDKSFVWDLLEDVSNPSIIEYNNAAKNKGESFKDFVEGSITGSKKCPKQNSGFDVYEWESSGLFPLITGERR